MCIMIIDVNEVQILPTPLDNWIYTLVDFGRDMFKHLVMHNF